MFSGFRNYYLTVKPVWSSSIWLWYRLVLLAMPEWVDCRDITLCFPFSCSSKILIIISSGGRGMECYLQILNTSHHVTWRHTTWHDATPLIGEPAGNMTSHHVTWRHTTWHDVTPRDMTSHHSTRMTDTIIYSNIRIIISFRQCKQIWYTRYFCSLPLKSLAAWSAHRCSSRNLARWK